MNRACTIAVLLTILAQAQSSALLDQALHRLAEEAEAFGRIARDVVSRETLEQRALKPPSRFRPRVGQAALDPPKPEYRNRTVVAEYAFSSFEDSPGALHEFRQIVSVDGRPLVSGDKARQTLTLGVRSHDDNVKKRILKDFEKLGLSGAATDLGPLILLFTKRGLANFRFQPAGVKRVGADVAVVVRYLENEGRESLTIFSGRKAVHQRLQGEIWLRESDYLPLRITLISARADNRKPMLVEAAVDYAQTGHGVVLPVAATARESVGKNVVTENVFRYEPFRRFASDSELKFDAIGEPPAKPPNP